MKRFVILVALTAFTLSAAFSQTAPTVPANLGGVTTGNLKSTPTHAVGDTLTDAGTKSQIIWLKNYVGIVTIQTTLTRLSGTLAGTVALYGSVNNVGYSLIDTATTLTNVASKVLLWKIAPSHFEYYKVVMTGSGTQSVKIISPAIWRKQD